MGSVAFGVLGPLQVERDGQPVQLNAPKLRVLLAALLLRANSPVPVVTLADWLWGEDPSPAAHKSTSMYVLRLRRMLGDDVVIETRPNSYLLRLQPDQLDLLKFQKLASDAREGAAEDERRLLAEALACWRGPALTDVPSEPLQRDEVPLLEEERLRVQERYFEVSLELGRHRDVLGELVRLTEHHPWQESFWALLLVALDGTGRRAEALETYRKLHRRFVEELGVEPGARLQRAHQAILNDGTEPVPATKAPVVVWQVPGDVQRFVGRTAVIDDLTRMVGAHRNVVISGPPGVGKTTLAIHVAHRWAEQFPDGQLYVNLQGFAADPPLSPAAALSRFVRALGQPRDHVPDDVEEQAALLRSMLTGRRMLLVLDNAVNADQVRPLLPGQGDCRVLITSRTDLRGLAVTPGAGHLPLTVLSGAESRAVLTDMVGTTRADAEPDAIGELANACAHLPLALRIAGANLAADPHRGVAAYTRELARGRLNELAIDGDERSAVRAAFDQSYLRLSEQDQTLFGLLGLAPGPDISTAAAAALVGAAERDTKRALERITVANLLHRTEPGRYAFHDLIREYAASRAATNDDAVTRLIDFYVAHADPNALSWLDEERNNLLAAMTWAATRPAARHHAWRLLSVLHGYLRARGHAREAVAACTQALDAATEAGDHKACMALLDLLGHLHHNLGDFDQAVGHHEQMLATARDLRDLDAEAEALRNVGSHLKQQGRPQDALRQYRMSLTVSRQAGNTEAEIMALNFIGVATAFAGEPADAVEWHEQSRDLAELSGNREAAHRALNGLGIAHWALGNLDESLDIHHQVLAYCRDAGQKFGELSSLACLAESHLDAGRREQARSFADDALTLALRMGDRRVEANLIRIIATIEHDQATYEKAVALAQEIGFRYGEAAALIGLASAVRGTDPRAALTRSERALALMREHGALLLEPDALTEMAHDQLELGDKTAATATATHAVQLAAHRQRRLVVQRARQVLQRI
ncbi:tetratricopeptide repeat protein [Lentzea alba]|uniref:AfsR/SARP family transcriptional regulator n=1 Tax=Lentzea alba TaxID=2714351 RepID=UPI0039BEDDEB